MSENSEKVMRVIKRKKIFAVEQMGGKCCICGYNKCVSALEFHHVEKKNEAPSYIIARWPWERVIEELKKCILVCSNCHRELHDGINGIKDTDIRKYLKPLIEMACKKCNKTFYTIREDAEHCSILCAQLSCRKVIDRPTKDELERLISEKPMVQIAKMYDVSDVAVGKWAKRYGINYRKYKTGL